MTTLDDPENPSWCLVVFILRGKQSKLLAAMSCLGVYIILGGMSLIQLVLLRCVAIYRDTLYLKNKMLYAREK